MDSYQKKIDRLQQESAEKRRLIANEHLATGRHLITRDAKLLSSTRLSTLSQESQRLQSQIDEARTSIARIHAILDREQQIDGEVDSLRGKIADLEESVQPMYEEIGRKAFEIYKSHPFVDENYVDLFSELVKNHEDIRDIDQQLVQLERETEEKPFLDRMVAKGKIALLRNRRTTREQNTPRLFRKAGRFVTESNFITVVDDATLTRAVEPYHQVNTQIDDLNRRIADLQKEDQSLAEDLRALGADRKAVRRVAELEQQIEDLTTALNNVSMQVGEGYLSELKKDDSGAAAVAESVARVRELERECQAVDKQIEKLKAAIAAEEAATRIAEYQKKIAALEKEIAENQASVEKLRGSIAETEAQKAQLEKARGPVDKL